MEIEEKILLIFVIINMVVSIIYFGIKEVRRKKEDRLPAPAIIILLFLSTLLGISMVGTNIFSKWMAKRNEEKPPVV